MQTKLPIEYSYKITETFYAGEYPFSKEPQVGKPKLKRLIDFGIKHFIDLTSEPMTRYSEFVPKPCTYTKRATGDYTVPDFAVLKEIHDRITEAERQNEKIYIHCRGGHDRTGAVVATYFIYQGFSPAEAKAKFRTVFVPPVKGRYYHTPLIETDWTVLDEYEQFLQQCQKKTNRT